MKLSYQKRRGITSNLSEPLEALLFLHFFSTLVPDSVSLHLGVLSQGTGRIRQGDSPKERHPSDTGCPFLFFCLFSLHNSFFSFHLIPFSFYITVSLSLSLALLNLSNHLNLSVPHLTRLLLAFTQ